MPKKLLENAAAEKEANDVGMRYMNSSDVLKDMRRDYGSAVDGIKVHDDSIANAKVTAAGRDGIASGKDIYMRAGSLSSHAPEVNGLLAHEVTHVMQQDSGMSQSVEYGSEQGGLLDFFKGLGRKKKRPEEELAISEPTFVKHTSLSEGDMDLSQLHSGADVEFAMALKEASESISDEDINQEHTQQAQQSALARGEIDLPVVYGGGAKQGQGVYDYRGKQSYALSKAVASASPEILRESQLAQSMVTDTFNQGMHSRLQDLKGRDLITNRDLFRHNGAGELKTMNLMMQKMLPEGYLQGLTKKATAGIAISTMTKDMQEGGKLSKIGDMMGGTRAAFEGSDFFDSDEEASAMMMNNFLLRAVLPSNSEVIAKRMEDYGMNDYTANFMKQRNADIMRTMKGPFADDTQRKSHSFLQALKERMSRRRGH